MDKLIHQWQDNLQQCVDRMLKDNALSPLDPTFQKITEVNAQMKSYLNMNDELKDPDIFVLNQ